MAALHAAELERVLMPRGAEEADAGALSLQEGVGGDGGAVQVHDRGLGGIDAGLPDDALDPGEDARDHVGRGRDLGVVHPLAGGGDHVREGAADVDADPQQGVRAPTPYRVGRMCTRPPSVE